VLTKAMTGTTLDPFRNKATQWVETRFNMGMQIDDDGTEIRTIAAPIGAIRI
jgi:hypothetical protein